MEGYRSQSSCLCSRGREGREMEEEIRSGLILFIWFYTVYNSSFEHQYPPGHGTDMCKDKHIHHCCLLHIAQPQASWTPCPRSIKEGCEVQQLPHMSPAVKARTTPSTDFLRASVICNSYASGAALMWWILWN